MSAVWTISDGTYTKSLSAWGITSAEVVRKSYAADELLFTIAREDVLGAPTFPYGTTLTLKRDGVVTFIGTVIREQASGSSNGEREGYLVVNAWWQLERLVYQQPRCIDTASVLTSLDTPDVVIGQTSLGGRYLQTSAAMVEVVTYALSKGVVLAPGAIVGGIEFQLEEASNLTCAEVLRRLGSHTPDSVMWVDYASGVQTLNFGRRAALAAVGYDLTAGDKIESWSVKARNDLVPAGVRFIFVSSEEDAETGRTMTRTTEQTAGAPDLAGGLIASIPMPGEGTDKPGIIPTNYALEYYAALVELQFEGRLVTRGEDVLGDVAPGKVLNLTNGRAAWATMRAVVQVVTEEILSGVTTVEFGPAERLPAKDFVDQLQFIRRMRAYTNLAAVRTCRQNGPDIDDEGEQGGEEEEDNPDAGVSPGGFTDEERFGPSAGQNINQEHGTVILTQCENGEDVDYLVVGRKVV